ncbi:hypothetical protein [Natrinema halophilum]|uniref:Uncharacterized protein n=1 Tax=Natrinema halophilum TaxID=1699371 RepID=A0A7D5H7Q3_9EURY|nr:hypothetical protein [Natrinema halophilum]QLG49295.1 hypothetical protein HYG82_10700 [Natrinema halophilum]
MPPREPFGHSGRFLAGVVLLGALLGLMYWTGAVGAEPLERGYPDEVDVTQNRDAYVGETVALGGIVVETEPVVIATQRSGYGRFTVVDADESLIQSSGPLETGDRVTAFGTLEDESTLVAERTVTDRLRDTLYMVLVSFGAGCWVLVRLVRGWRIDRDRFALVPRTATGGNGGERDSGNSMAPRETPVSDGSNEDRWGRKAANQAPDGGDR